MVKQVSMSVETEVDGNIDKNITKARPREHFENLTSEIVKK